MNTIEADAVKAAKQISPFSFNEFENDFIKDNLLFIQRNRKCESVSTNAPKIDIKPYKKRISLLREIHPGNNYISVTFFSYIIKLLEESRIGSALNYQDAYNSLKKFRGNIRFIYIVKKQVF